MLPLADAVRMARQSSIRERRFLAMKTAAIRQARGEMNLGAKTRDG
jgi:hypothetical protein